MRYIKLKTIITKTADEEITDPNDIIAILSVLSEKELDCCIKMVNGPRLELVRILALKDHSFQMQAISKTSSVIRWVAFDEIERIEVHHFDSDIVHKKPKISRWMLLGSVSFLEDES